MRCETCHGTGKAFVSIPPGPNMMLAERLAALGTPCPDCGGSGIVAKATKPSPQEEEPQE